MNRFCHRLEEAILIGFVSDPRYAFRAAFEHPRFSLVAIAALVSAFGESHIAVPGAWNVDL